MICDDGTQFVSKIVKYLAKEWSVQLQTTAPVQPTVESRGTFQLCGQNHGCANVRDHQKAWDMHLEELQIAVNTVDHYSTGYTPAMLCFGRKLQASQSHMRSNL